MLVASARTQRPPHARPHHSQPRHTPSHARRTRPARPPPPSDAPLRPPARRRQPCALRDGSRVKGLPDTARRGKRILLAPAVAGAQPAGATLTRTASPNPTCGHGPARPWPGRDRSLRRCPLTALLTLLGITGSPLRSQSACGRRTKPVNGLCWGVLVYGAPQAKGGPTQSTAL